MLGETYLATVTQRLSSQGYECTDWCFHGDLVFRCVARRTKFEVMKVAFTETAFVFAELTSLTNSELSEFSAKCIEYVLETRKDRYQTCILCVPVALCDGADAAGSASAIRLENISKIANLFTTILVQPVIYHLKLKMIFTSPKTPYFAGAYWPGFRRLVRETLSV